MTKIHSLLTLLLFVAALGAYAQSVMTDRQVIEYYEQGIAQGKSREEIASELMLRGVTREQAQRVAEAYQAQQQQAPVGSLDTGDRSHLSSSPETALADQGTDEILASSANAIYGYDLFRNRNLSFTPSASMATPRNYRLGPGDEVIIDIYGAAQQTIRQTISPEGSIVVDYLGPVYLNGLTVEEANSFLGKKLSAIYSGLGQGGNMRTNIRLTLGQIRSIQIDVLGDVAVPGTYTVSSFSTILNALYRAGGIVEPGSLRNIALTRGGKTVGQADIYELLTTGSREHDIRLEDGDVILVRPYTEMVKISGMVKRPMYFEMKEGETLAQLIAYAGGFTSNANTASISVIRQNGKRFEVSTVESGDFARFVLQNGDEVSVGRLQSRFENRVSVTGAVFFPGIYEHGEGLRTVRELVAKAGGLLPEAFTGRAVINREHDDRTLEVLSINLERVLSGADPDFVLRKNDELIIASKNILEDAGTMSIHGMVARPGVFPFAANTTVEDLIIMAGGLQNGASTARVDVTRLRKDATGMVVSDSLAELHSFSLKDGLIADGEQGFVLEPYDEVVVHRSPAFVQPVHFTISGEVNFPGQYTMTGRGERLSDAVNKAGGLTQYSYADGARLLRTLSATEQQQLEEARESLLIAGDTLSLNKINLTAGTYQIAIELGKALALPGSTYDVELREGDVLEIPTFNNTVKTSGAVMAPGAMTYVPGRTASYYIRLSGGYAHRANRSYGYIVSMNGEKRPLRGWSSIQPGDELIIPMKEKKDVDVRSSVVAYSSAAASIATIGVTIMTLINQNRTK